MPTAAFCTLGCKVNQYDSQAMLEILEKDGYSSIPFGEKADVYVVNTCTVTSTGDQKSRQMIRRAHRQNPQAAIVVTGCMAQRAAKELLLPGVRLILGTQRRAEIAELLRRAMAQEEPVVAVEPLGKVPFEKLQVTASEGHTRATLKIQEGCRNFCTYCIIPSVRGPIRSRPLEDVEAEACRLAQAGFEEIVVTGIHLASYGLDMDGKWTLLDALEAIHRAPGVKRIRLGSLEPRIVTEEFARRLQEMPKVCPQFMLALQSGCDTVLHRMGRRYTTGEYAAAVAALRKAYGDPALTTDLMCGFPGETEEEFQETLKFVKEIGFARIHVFPYSEREGTPAAKMPDSVPKQVREERARRLIEVGKEMEAEYASRLKGQIREVLFERACPGGAEGYTGEYVRVVADGTPGKLQRVHILDTNLSQVRGAVLREEKDDSIR